MSSVTIATKHAPWIRYRNITGSEAALSVTSRKGTNVPSTAYRIPAAMNNVEVRLAAKKSGDACTGAYFYSARYLDKAAGTYDDISLIGSAILVAGDQLSSDNYYYVHLVTLTDRWITEVKKVDGDGNDGMSRIAFDASGYDVFFMRIAYVDVTDWKVDLSGW